MTAGGRWAARRWSGHALWITAVLALGLAVRLPLLVRSGWLLEGDDSLSVLMALDVLAGDRPLMLKNQTYAAAWEPYAMAVSYALFGVSRVSAKLPALLGSLAFIGTTWLLAREVGGPIAARFAAVLAAVPPIYVLVLSLKPWAPYTEVMLGGSLALVCAVRLGWPRVGQRDGWWALGCGVCGGFAFWMHPLAVWYLIAAGGVVLARVRGLRLARVGVIGGLGFLVGSLPFWIFQFQTQWSTFRFVARAAGAQSASQMDVLLGWWHNDLPRGMGLFHPWGESPTPVIIVPLVIIVVALAWALVGRPTRGLRPLDGILLLLVTIPTVLVFSGFGGPVLNEYDFDATGRYTPPIWNALAIVLGVFLAAVWSARKAISIVLAALLVAVNLAGWAAIDPVQAFQSPYWSKLPVDNQPLLTALRERGISHVWLNHWAGLPVMFDAIAAGQPLRAYDWYDVEAGGIDRFPEYRALLEQAERPAFVLVTDEEEPELFRRLDALDVSYEVDRRPPYVVVVPTSRRVHPSEVAGGLDYRY